MMIATMAGARRGWPAGLLAAVVGATLLAAAPTALAAPVQRLQFRTINVPGADDTRLAGINDKGVLAGTYVQGAFVNGFIQAGSKITRFSYPGADETIVEGINDQGAVVGNYFGSGGLSGAFLRSPSGHFTSLNDPLARANGTFADGINDRGEIVGGYAGSNGADHGFIDKSGRFTTVDVPHGFYGAATWGSAVFGVNNAGILVGPYTPKVPVTQGYVDTAGQFITLTAPGPGGHPSIDTEARAISNLGAIVGWSSGANGVPHGWLLSCWRYIPLNDPLAVNRPGVNGEQGGTSPTGINRQGVVVGTFWDKSYAEHGFMVHTSGCG